MLSSKKYEEFAYVLDNLPQGYANDPRPTFQRDPITQAVGETHFTLLELVPRKGVTFSLHERIYIGKGSRKKINHVQKRIRFDDLTPTAKSELPFVIEKIVVLREKEFVSFFNNARPITTRMHQLKLIPGIGRKTMWLILEERKKESFKSFEDINNRVRMPEPKKAIVNRILSELKGEDKYNLFTRPHTTSQE
ncbi:MAG: DUF655 domain-containing protein [Candidatus Jordarchaeum sp.]|uniref:DUF655 domain-containing protein n=1 Tax=Candidatus Jordarchaeum sp. TaxID=2823881 RepID=UPI00404A864D